MKTIDRPKRVWLIGMAVLAAAAMLAGGCDDENESPTDEGTSAPLTMESIIASPKAGSPGDTLLLSAIVTSTDPNEGDIPAMSWTATGGAFLEDDQSSVRWVAPANGIYQVTARATNAVNSVTLTSSVFIGESITVVGERAGEIRVHPNGTDLYYFRTAVNPAFGAEVFKVLGGVGGGTDAVVTPGGANGSNNHMIAWAPDISFEAHSVDSLNPSAENTAKHLYLGDFSTSEYRKISYDSRVGERYGQFTDPDVSSDSRFVAFGARLPSIEAVDPDSFDIVVYDKQGPGRRVVTRTHTNHRNVFPSWSTDQRWLTFVSDRTTRNAWDLYGLPATGGIVDESPAGVVRLSNTGGTLAAGNIGDFAKPVMEWNPVSATLAIMALDNLYLIVTNQAGASQVDTGLAPLDMEWSPDGTLLAVSLHTTEADGVATVESDGSLSDRRVFRAGDTFNDLAWTADGAWLIYRVTRGSSSWLEAFELDGLSASAPIPITGTSPHTVGNRSLGEYRGLMSMKAVSGSANSLFYPAFTGAGTPGIQRLDVSGLSP